MFNFSCIQYYLLSMYNIHTILIHGPQYLLFNNIIIIFIIYLIDFNVFLFLLAMHIAIILN